KQWWGTPESLHLDAWGMLKSVDGYDVILKNEPANHSDDKLYFVNLGGYDSQQFTELHKNIFVVAKNEIEAKKKAVATVSHWNVPHKDNLYEIDVCVNVNTLLREIGLLIHLQ